MHPAARSSSRLRTRLRGAVLGWAALTIGHPGTGAALGAEERGGGPRSADEQPSGASPSRFELCFVEPVDEQLRQQVTRLLQARLEPQRWVLISSTEGSTSSGLARLRSAEVDLALLLEARGELWRVYVVEPKAQRSVTREIGREIGGATRDAAASEAVVSIAVSAVEAARTRMPEEQPETTEPAAQDARATVETARPTEVRGGEVRADAPQTARTDVGDVVRSADAAAANLRWGVGVGADFGALSNAVGWSLGPLLTGHAFWGTAPLSGEVRMHAAQHLPRTIEAGVGSFDWSRTLLGVNVGPTWWLARRASVGVDAGLKWERATRSHAVAHGGAEGLPGRPHHRSAIQLNLIGTLFSSDDFGLRLGGGAQWWFGETRYVASNGDVLLALPRLNGSASLSLLWRIP